MWDEIRKAYKEDPYIQSVTQLAKTQTEGPYTQRQGLFYFRGRVLIPFQGELRKRLLHEAHDTKIGGHSGVS